MIFTRLLRFLIVCQLLAANSAFALVNQLKDHASPYLALHAADPVAWQDWNEEALQLARREGKLLYLSIGYFSCHWCHVMQRESYRNREIAGFLNKHFIPVKVDRELEPALDASMIEFAESTRGMGGWPLNVFITPEGYPLYATLYSPPPEFLEILKRLQDLWARDKEGLSRTARESRMPAAAPARIDAGKIDVYAGKFMSQAMEFADHVQGGFGEESKFPSVPQLRLLLLHLQWKPDPGLRKFLTLTLDQMANNGLQDHLHGGFFRYTVDPGWKTPHFEKMLYDNALLAGLYLKAADVLEREDYRAVARRTLDFMMDAMRGPGGAFIASLSAVDAEGAEGGYYLWSKEALGAALTSEEKRIYMLAQGMRDAPPFDEGYLPFPDKSPAEVAKMLKLEQGRVEVALARAEKKLIQARHKRRLPRDIKQLAGWNGLALIAFAESARVTGADKYKNAARDVRDYLIGRLWDGKSLRRAVDTGRAVGRVSLEDYAFVAQGLLAWAELTGAESDYALAKKITLSAWERFYDGNGWRMEERSLIPSRESREIIADSPLPSPSALLLEVSLELARLTRDSALRAKAMAGLQWGRRQLEEMPFLYATHLGVLLANQ